QRTELETVGSLKLLGLTFQRNMKFDLHIKETARKVQSIVGQFLSKLRRKFVLNYKKRRMIYHAVIRSALAYHCEVYFDKSYLKYELQRQEGPCSPLYLFSQIQHACLKRVCVGYRTTSRIACEALGKTEYIGHYLFERQNIYLAMKGIVDKS